MQSQDERDMEGIAARKERDGVVKEFGGEEITGRYEGEELEERRAQRPPDERFGRLEKKHDELKQDVEKKHDDLKKDVSDVRSDVKVLSGQFGDMRSAVSGAVGKLDGQEKLLTETLTLVRKTHDREADREHVTFTATVDVDRAKELAKVDVFDAKKKKREMVMKGVGLIAGGGGLIELLHRLGVL
jgi:bifunctional N-acetylglucosamine-1-phosphate-uridyltransferase/glucosamine-1-phosphate-acetyltransferase GlmU-like protein